MRDTLDVNAGKNRIWGVLGTVLGVLLFATFLAFLIMRKSALEEAEQPHQEMPVKSETVETVDGNVILGFGVESEDNTQNVEDSQVIGEEEVLPPNTYLLPDKETVTFTFAGDVLLDDSYAIMSTYRANGSVLEECIDPALLEIMHNSDVFMINNEFPYKSG